MQNPNLVSVIQLSKLTGISDRTIYHWLKVGDHRLPPPLPNRKPVKWLRYDVIKHFKLDDTNQIGGGEHGR